MGTSDGEHGIHTLMRLLKERKTDLRNFDDVMNVLKDLTTDKLVDVFNELQERILLLARATSNEDFHATNILFFQMSTIVLATRGELENQIRQAEKRRAPKTGPTKPISERDKNKVIAMHKRNYSNQDIAKELNIGRNKVGRIINDHYDKNP